MPHRHKKFGRWWYVAFVNFDIDFLDDDINTRPVKIWYTCRPENGEVGFVTIVFIYFYVKISGKSLNLDFWKMEFHKFENDFFCVYIGSIYLVVILRLQTLNWFQQPFFIKNPILWVISNVFYFHWISMDLLRKLEN